MPCSRAPRLWYGGWSEYCTFTPPSPPIPTGVVPNSAPCQIMHPLSIGRFRRRCGGGVRIRGGVGIRQSDSEGMHNLAGVQISAQHRP